MLKSVKKACRHHFAVESAIVCHTYDDRDTHLQDSVDVLSLWRCQECGYLGKSKVGLSLHRVVVHQALVTVLSTQEEKWLLE